MATLIFVVVPTATLEFLYSVLLLPSRYPTSYQNAPSLRSYPQSPTESIKGSGGRALTKGRVSVI